MYQWATDAQSSVVRLSDGAIIPCATGNRDFHDFQAWQAAGNTPTQAAQQPLAIVKTEAKARIGAAAETARHQYITPGSGKAMSYQEVSKEAETYSIRVSSGADPLTDNGQPIAYPFLQARVSSGRYPNLAAAVAGTMAMGANWASIGAAIDEIEDRAKLAIDAATTVDEVRVAEQVTWP